MNRNIKIDLDSEGIGRVIIGEKDISDFVTSIDISSNPGETPKVFLELMTEGKIDILFKNGDLEISKRFNYNENNRF